MESRAETVDWATGPPPPRAPAHCSQIHRFGRDSRSPRHSGSWPGCTCSWTHSGTAWARTRPRGAWQLGDRAGQYGQQALPSGRVTPTPYPDPTVNPAHLPLVSLGSLSLLTHVTHSCPDEIHTLLPQHCQLSSASHRMARHITLSPPHSKRVIPGTAQSLSSLHTQPASEGQDLCQRHRQIDRPP